MSNTKGPIIHYKVLNWERVHVGCVLRGNVNVHTVKKCSQNIFFPFIPKRNQECVPDPARAAVKVLYMK